MSGAEEAMADAMVDVLVSGAVESVGHHLIPAPATIEAALQAAGGLARRPQMWPAGPITVRRPLGDRKVVVWRFSLDDPEPQAWRRFELCSGDAVIFQWTSGHAD
jgi:hypothetical protein